MRKYFEIGRILLVPMAFLTAACSDTGEGYSISKVREWFADRITTTESAVFSEGRCDRL